MYSFKVEVTINIGNCNLYPIEPSHIVVQPGHSIHLPAGSSLVFYCVAYGVPLPSITWRNSSAGLASDSVTTIHSELVNEGGVLALKSRLEICKAERSNVYTCFGENHLGSENFSTEVIADASRGTHICSAIITVLYTCLEVHFYSSCVLIIQLAFEIAWLNSLHLTNSYAHAKFSNCS